MIHTDGQPADTVSWLSKPVASSCGVTTSSFIEDCTMGLFEWFGGLRWWVRLCVALFFLLLSTLLWLAGYFWPWGWAVGGVLLLFSFPSDAEKKGYHDF